MKATVGGAGDDILAGGLGDDVFEWTFGDQGSEDDPAVDSVTDLELGDNALDIAELLQDEDNNDISDYILAKEGEGEEEGNLLLYLKHDGGDAGIELDGSNADQVIKLEGKSFASWADGDGNAFNNGEDLIHHLIETGQINIDQ